MSDTAFNLLETMAKELREDLRSLQNTVDTRCDRIEAELRGCATKEDLDNLAASIPTTETILRKLEQRRLEALEGYEPHGTTSLVRPAVSRPSLSWKDALQHPGYVLGAIAVVVFGAVMFALIAAVWDRDATTLVPYRINPETGAPYVVPTPPSALTE